MQYLPLDQFEEGLHSYSFRTPFILRTRCFYAFRFGKLIHEFIRRRRKITTQKRHTITKGHNAKDEAGPEICHIFGLRETSLGETWIILFLHSLSRSQHNRLY